MTTNNYSCSRARLALLIAAAATGQVWGQQAIGAAPLKHPGAVKRSYTPASVHALPGLQCRIYPEGGLPSEGLTLFTDDDGYARFHAVQAAAGDKTQKLVLNCEDSAGKPSVYSADLTSDDTFVPRPVNLANERGTDRPALAGDPLSYTQSELIRSGYGLRPDSEKSPAAYARWLAAASMPGRFLEAKRPSSHSHTVTTETGAPWVGSVLGGAPNYIAVEGNFNVPKAVPAGDETVDGTELSIWNGLGGWNTGSGLIQAGVSVETVGSAAIYGSWREFCCGPGGDSNGYGGAFTPNPGDTIYDENWYCDSEGNFNIKGGYGCNYLEDVTTGAVLSCTSPSGSPCWSAKVHSGMTLGVNAEFVIENQSSQCCAPATQFTDFTPEVTMTGSAYSSTTDSFTQTIGTDSQVDLLIDYTHTTSHMNVSLGTTDQTYFSVSQWETTGGLAYNGLVAKCGSSLGCYAESIGVGPNAEGSSIGDAWVLGTSTNSAGDDYLVYRWVNSKWVKQPNAAGVMIAVSPTGNPWIVNHLGQISYYNGSTWVPAPGDGCATSIGVGPNAYGSTYGDPWVIGCDGGYGKNGNVYQLQGSAWVQQPGFGTQIAVAPDSGIPWVITADGGIYYWIGGGFAKVPTGCATSIAVGPLSAGIWFGDAFGDAWVTGCTISGTGSGIFQLQEGVWVKIPGAATQIAVSPDLGVPWTVNNLGQIYQ